MEDKPDYYFNEEGLLVFTREYHLKRGYCCKSGCLHCPWNYRKSTSEIHHGDAGENLENPKK